ncbi:MAG: hypothetical protein Ct9H90mP15_03160 [Candidatus Neomarinimicrobiota bacterium]|nr:MAG: hypothetical protein Ct9H90mP15_03160 [Candidatus Neomarinimicrobiota bacterium]
MFPLVYPLSFTFSDGSSHTVNDKDEFRAALKANMKRLDKKKDQHSPIQFKYSLKIEKKQRQLILMKN